MHAPTDLYQTFLLPLVEGVIVTPCILIGARTHYVQIDGVICSNQFLVERLKARDQELCLRTDAIGKIVESVVSEVENGAAHQHQF